MSSYTPIEQFSEGVPIRATCFHPSGDAYVVGTNSKAVLICKYPDHERRMELAESGTIAQPQRLFTFLRQHVGSVYCAAFNSTGNLLATGSNDQIVHVIRYDPAKCSPLGKEYKFSIHTGTVRAVKFLHDNVPESAKSRLLSAGAGDFGIYLTDCDAMKSVRAFRGHEATVMTLDGCVDSPDLFVSGSLDGTIRLWDVRTKESISTVVNRRRHQQPSRLPTQKPLPQTPLASVDGDTSFELPNATRIVSAADPQELPRDQENLQPVRDGPRVPRRRPPPPPASSGAAPQTPAAPIDGPLGGAQRAALEPSGDCSTGALGGLSVGSVRLDPSGRLLVSGHSDGSCMLYDVRAAKITQTFQAHDDEIRSVDFSPRSYYLLTASYDCTVKLTDLQGELAQPLPCVEAAELPDKVVQVAWHPHDYNFVTTCANGTATLWSVPDFDDWLDSQIMETSVIL